MKGYAECFKLDKNTFEGYTECFKLDKILLLLLIITYQTGYGLAWYILLYSTVCVIRVVKMWTHEVQPKGLSENT